MRTRTRALAVLAGAVAVLASVPAGPAGAAGINTVDCRTPGGGAGGTLNWGYTGKTKLGVVVLSAHDLASDGAWARVRLDIVTGSGKRVTYSWRANHDGAGTTKRWKSYASESSGIVSARVEAQKVKGSSPVSSCYSRKAYNPYY
ncbi:hypothetical protein [Streptomyces platensis]|uniref:hypothetical protein n=1 Tax=Streptomyces platensis TaxID=58346 RepID=UPI001F48A913|nr:hypothetical protein [Streptomyces platensis]MCF3144570.1 hypothetical protein [Streptomyces platensis]